MRSYEFVTEMNAIASYGDWKPDSIAIGYMSELVLKKYYKRVSALKIDGRILEIYHTPMGSHKDSYKVGAFTPVLENDKRKFEVLLECKILTDDVIKKIDDIFVSKDERGVNLTKVMYAYFGI